MRTAAPLLLVALLLGACPQRPDAGPPPPPRVPEVRLLLLVVVDQLPWDTFARVRPALSGGLARLADEGVVLSRAEHRHGVTVTAAGHATLVTGLYPRHHGIVGNDWYDRERHEQVWAHEDPESEVVSAIHLLATGLGDWVRDRDPRSRSFAAAGKERSAVLMGGKHPNGAFWFDEKETGFATSEAYPPPPAWLATSPHRAAVRARFGTSWEPLPLPPGIDPAALGFVQLEGTGLPRPFPHALGDASTHAPEWFYTAVADSPFGDEHLGAFAQELIVNERLGAGDHLDYLALSFSGVDAVGHEYGQHSLEMLDALLRLDRTLAALFEVIDREVGREHVVVAFSADHGAPPMPERQRLVGAPGYRKTPETIACVQRIPGRLDAEYGPHRWFEWNLYLDEEEVRRSGVPRAEVERRIAEWLEECPGIDRAWTRSELEGPLPAAAARDPFLLRYRAAFHPRRSPDFLLQHDPWYVDRMRGTTHRTPYSYDAHVPLVLMVPGVEPRTIDHPVSTADLAPTLATLLGLRPGAPPDGRDFSALLLPRR